MFPTFESHEELHMMGYAKCKGIRPFVSMYAFTSVFRGSAPTILLWNNCREKVTIEGLDYERTSLTIVSIQSIPRE